MSKCHIVGIHMSRLINIFLFLHVRFQEFLSGVQACRPENSLDKVFFFFSFLVQFTVGVQWFNYRENYTFPRIQRGANIFQWGGGGPNANSYRNPYNL